MPGIAGFLLKGALNTVDLIKNMAQAMSQRPDHHLSLHVVQDKGLALARVGHPFANLGPGVGLVEDEEAILIFDGELYGETTEGDPLLIFQGLKEEGEAFLGRLKGLFNLAFFDKKDSCLLLANDKFGLKPIYYTWSPEGVLFASEVKALLAWPRLSKEVDFRALADFFYYGHLLGDKTLFRHVRLLSPGSILLFKPSGSCELRAYWRLRELFSPEGYQDLPTSEIVYAFGQAVKRRLKFREHLGISLSGGLDSRAILAAMGAEAQGIPSYTLGLKGCQDERFAALMAQIAGTRHTFVEITEEHLKDFQTLAETLIWLSDGMYHPHESTEKAALEYFQRAPFKILLRGHGGEIAKASLAYPVQPTEEVFGLEGKEVIDFIFSRANLVLRDANPEGLFVSKELKEELAIARSSLEEVLAPVSSLLSPVDLTLYYFIKEYIRRQAVASLAIFRSQVEIRLPFMDEDFLDLLLRLHPKRRWAGEIHVAVVRQYQPALIKVPNSNTGAPLDAGRLRLLLTDKFNSLLKRLSLPGFRHYTEFSRWQRKYFRESTRQLLFDKRTLERGIYDPQGLKEIFEAHVSGQKNYAHLLGTMVGIELWFRDFVD
ncbi:asparagine synthetase B family protein [Thermosulfuriphilus sp.]